MSARGGFAGVSARFARQRTHKPRPTYARSRGPGRTLSIKCASRNSRNFARVYPLYAAKAEKKARTEAEVDQVIAWLTGAVREIRYLDKLIDELARGKIMDKILRKQ